MPKPLLKLAKLAPLFVILPALAVLYLVALHKHQERDAIRRAPVALTPGCVDKLARYGLAPGDLYLDAAAWARDNEMANYFWMKQAVCAYVASTAYAFGKKGIRINATCPGPTDTPLAQANKETWLGFGADYRKELGIEAATPMEQAYPLLFLCSAAASAISGVTLITDSGYIMSGITETYPSATPMAKILMGRM